MRCECGVCGVNMVYVCMYLLLITGRGSVNFLNNRNRKTIAKMIIKHSEVK